MDATQCLGTHVCKVKDKFPLKTSFSTLELETSRRHLNTEHIRGEKIHLYLSTDQQTGRLLR